MRNKHRYAKIVNFSISMGLVLVVWQVLSLFFSPHILPGVGVVVLKLVEILSTASLYEMIGLTVVRMVIGLSIGVAIGLFLGIIMGARAGIHRILMPIVGILQTVPPVSWVILALVWFGFNGRPAMFIVAISTIPVIAINIYEGFLGIDTKLRQMAQLYRFSRKKELRHVILPSITPYFRSAFRIALGTGWKITVMGEVLTTSDGIGGMIKLARLNIEPESIIAWSIVVVGLFYLSDILLGKLFKERINAAG